MSKAIWPSLYAAAGPGVAAHARPGALPAGRRLRERPVGGARAGAAHSGARRLEHLRYVAGDPLLRRFCGLARLPTARTLAHWLKRFTRRHVAALRQLNEELVTTELARLQLSRLTLDMDGTVIRAGGQVAWAFRGFTPHHRKNPSSYPLLVHVAQTGHNRGACRRVARR